MVKLIREAVSYGRKTGLTPCKTEQSGPRGTIADRILSAHHTGPGAEGEANLKIKFDGLASHDITYVGIIQTARASGFDRFPVPYALTNCHNSLCAVGGTINEDDHVFGLSAAKKYGGIYVPAHQAVIHSYLREMMAGCGKMLLGSDSHTRYGALGTMGVGEGGPELVKQLLGRTYDIARPDIVAVWLEGEPAPGVGPQDVALAIIGAVFESGFVKNKVMEFLGPGVASLPVDFRSGIDVMTTETTCLSSVWTTDDQVAAYYDIHGRPDDYRKLEPDEGARYDGAIVVDLSAVVPMIALPFHPSNVYPIAELNKHAADIFEKVERDAKETLGGLPFTLTDKIHGGAVWADQGIIAGCAGGTFDNLMDAASILKQAGTMNDYFSLSVYPGSQPIYAEIARNGALSDLITAGVNVKTAFCGPCFGAGDVPANNGFSVRHATRNFPSREGSKPTSGQIASVALMDARSVAATAVNGGRLTPATELVDRKTLYAYRFDRSIYDKRVYNGFGKPDPTAELRFGPNIADWPPMIALTDHLALEIASVIRDVVTTTDELIPSGETSSYRSNPLRLAEFTLSRKDPAYVGRAKAAYEKEKARREGSDALGGLFAHAAKETGAAADSSNTAFGSAVFANKPGDGSAREQAASCQRVLGGAANVAVEYATKRYRSNLINWGMLPLLLENPADAEKLAVGSVLFLPNIRAAVAEAKGRFDGYLLTETGSERVGLTLGRLTPDEIDIILAGCLINYYRSGK